MSQFWRNNETREAVKSAFLNCDYLVSFDTETTGLKPCTDVVIEIGAIRFKIVDHKTLVRESELHLYIRPPFAVSPQVTAINGLTNEFLRTQPYLEAVFPQIEAFFSGNVAFAAYNSKFDREFMKAMFSSQGKVFPEQYEIDVLKMARDFVKPNETQNYKLATICDVLGIQGDFKFHGAMDDTEVSTAIMKVILNDYFSEPEIPVIQLEKPSVFSVRYWEGYRGHSRVYVSTSVGSVFYDCFNKNWGSKDCDLAAIDMGHVERVALSLTSCKTINDLASFRGSVSA